MVMHQPGDAALGEVGHLARLRIAEDVLAVPIVEAEIHMQPAAALVQERLRHEGEDDAVVERHFPRQHPEQEDVIDRLHRLVIGQGELELRASRIPRSRSPI